MHLLFPTRWTLANLMSLIVAFGKQSEGTTESSNVSDPNLSSFIWSVADLLRGDYKQSDYGKVILPFTVLRRLDCVLEANKPVGDGPQPKNGRTICTRIDDQPSVWPRTRPDNSGIAECDRLNWGF